MGFERDRGEVLVREEEVGGESWNECESHSWIGKVRMGRCVTFILILKKWIIDDT